MANALTVPEEEQFPGRKHWTRTEVNELIDSGRLVGRYELIDGEIIDKMGQNPAHMFGIMLAMQYLLTVFNAGQVRVQGSILIPGEDAETNEPEPDLAVTVKSANAYAHRHPMPADLLLLIEVSDATRRFDLRTKALLYARAGVGEYWSVDIPMRQIHVHRTPTPSGYNDVIAFPESALIAPLARPEASVIVGTLLPPPETKE